MSSVDKKLKSRPNNTESEGIMRRPMMFRTPLARWFAVVGVLTVLTVGSVVGYRALYNWVDAGDHIIPGTSSRECNTRHCQVTASTWLIIMTPFAVIAIIVCAGGFAYLIWIDLRDSISSGRGFTSSGLFIFLAAIAVAAVVLAVWFRLSITLAPSGVTAMERFNSGAGQGAAAMLISAIALIVGYLMFVTFCDAYRDTTVMWERDLAKKM